jgi:hypothetical protein
MVACVNRAANAAASFAIVMLTPVSVLAYLAIVRWHF